MKGITIDGHRLTRKWVVTTALVAPVVIYLATQALDAWL